MKILITILFFISIPAFIKAQYFTVDTVKNSVEVYGDFNGAEIHLPVVKKLPEFKGGKKAWQDFLKSNINIKVPFANSAKPGTYHVVIRFIVGDNGNLHSVGADSNCGYGLEAEVIRCVKKSESWQPAETASGMKVGFSVKTMVIFEIETNDVIVKFI